MKKKLIIVAGGRGRRLGSDIPKQFLVVGKLPVLMATINHFLAFDNNIDVIVGLPEDLHEYWKGLCKKYRFKPGHKIVGGGETRFHTVKNCLGFVPGDCLVAVHDGVRPFVSQGTIERCFEAALKSGAAIPVMPVSESLRIVEEGNSKALNRQQYRTVQTPGVFHATILKEAYNVAYNPVFTDDASVVENTGHHITLVDGNVENIKITTQNDLLIAQCYFKGLR